MRRRFNRRGLAAGRPILYSLRNPRSPTWERRHLVRRVASPPRLPDRPSLRLRLGPRAGPHPLAGGPGRRRGDLCDGGAVRAGVRAAPAPGPGARRGSGAGRAGARRGARGLAGAVGRARRCDDIRGVLRHARDSAHDRGTAAGDGAHPPAHGAARSRAEEHGDALRRQCHGRGARGRRAGHTRPPARPERARARTPAGCHHRPARPRAIRDVVAVLGGDGRRLSASARRAALVRDGARPRPRDPGPCPGAGHGRGVPGRDAGAARRAVPGHPARRGRRGERGGARELHAAQAARGAVAGHPRAMRRRPGAARPAAPSWKPSACPGTARPRCSARR